MPYTGHVLEVRDAEDIPKALAVGNRYPMPGLDGLVHMLEVDEPHSRAHLVHLSVDAGGHNSRLAGETEVLQVVYPLLGLRIMHYQSTALYRVVHLGCVEAERRHVASVQDALPVHLHAEGMRSVVDDFQAVLVRYVLYTPGVARLAIAVHRHDGRGPRGYRCLDAVRVDAAVRRVDVHEHRLDAVPPQRVGRRHEAERSRYDLARDAQGLQRCYQRQGAVGEKADVGNLEILAQGRLKFLMPVSVVGDPFAGPDVPKVRVELVQVRKERGRHGYLSVVHRLFLAFSEDSEYGVPDFNVFRKAERLAQTGYYRRAGAQLHEEHPYRTQIQQRQGKDTGEHYCGYAEGREDVPYLGPHRVADKFPRVSGVEPVCYDACNQRAPQHPLDAQEDSKQQRADGDDLLHYLKLQEQVRPALHLEHVQVDGVQRIQRRREADYLKIMGGLLPLRADEHSQQGLRHRGQAEKQHERRQHRGTDDLPVALLHPILLILNGTKNRIAHPLHYRGHVRREEIRELLAPCILSQSGRGVALAYNKLVDLLPHRVDKARHQKLPAEAEQLTER